MLVTSVNVLGEQGWRSGESTCLPSTWPRFDSQTQRHMWVEFVVGSRPCSERFFSGYSGFPSPQKPTFPNSNSIWRMSLYCKAHLIMSSWNYTPYKFTIFCFKLLPGERKLPTFHHLSETMKPFGKIAIDNVTGIESLTSLPLLVTSAAKGLA